MLIDGFKVEFVQPSKDQKRNTLAGLLTLDGKLQNGKSIFMKAELGPHFDVQKHLTAGIGEGTGENYRLRIIYGVELFSDPSYHQVLQLYSKLMCDISHFHQDVVGKGLD